MTVHVRGESGVGKSALVRRFVENLRASAPDVVVLHGRCYERESVPYKALDGVVDALARWLARLPKVEAALMLPARAGLLAEVFPVLRRVEAVAQAPRPPSDGDPQQLRRQLFTALRELSGAGGVEARARRRHRRSAVGRPRLAGAARRDHASARRAGDAVGRHGARGRGRAGVATVAAGAPRRAQVHLSRLPPDEARALASELLSSTGGVPSAELSAGAIAEEAGGHPLFIDELVRHAPPGVRRARRAPAPRGRAVGPRAPARGRLRSACSSWSPSPVDRSRSRRWRARPMSTSPPSASTRRRCARPTWCAPPGTRPADLIEPYHDRVRATIESHRTATEVRRAHERVALGLESTGRADPEALAMHWQGAGENDKAAAYATQAAERAYKALAFDRAAQLYRQTLVMRPPGAADVATLQVRLGDALAQTGRGAEAARAYLSAAERSTTGPADALELRRRAAEQLLRAGHVDDGLQAMIAGAGGGEAARARVAARRR